MDYFHTISALHHKLLDYFTNGIGIRFGTIIQTIASSLYDGAQASETIEDQKHYKKQEAKRLERCISEKNLWVNIDVSSTITNIYQQKTATLLLRF